MTDAARDRLSRYEHRSNPVMLVLALSFLLLYGAPIIWTDLPSGLLTAIEVLSVVVWSAFIVDLAARAWLSGRPGGYLLRHPIDVLLIALPMLRPLRVLRVFTAANYLVTRSGRFAVGRTLLSAAAATLLLMVIAALAVLDSERGAAGAQINSFGDALWWSGTTVTTVGYGDLYPVTTQGRFAAFALMLVGISVLGLTTASVAAWFVSKTREADDDVLVELRALRAQVANLEEMASGQAGASSGGLSPRGGAADR